MSENQRNQAAGTLIVAIEPDAEEWGSRSDQRWKDDLFTLRQAVEFSAGDAVEPAPMAKNAMGFELVPIVVALGNAGAFSALVAGLKAWLNVRPQRRSVTANWQIGDRQGTVTVTGENLASNDLSALVQEIVKSGA
jgi:Effector Associated Constant Component 1